MHVMEELSNEPSLFFMNTLYYIDKKTKPNSRVTFGTQYHDGILTSSLKAFVILLRICVSVHTHARVCTVACVAVKNSFQDETQD